MLNDEYFSMVLLLFSSAANRMRDFDLHDDQLKPTNFQKTMIFQNYFFFSGLSDHDSICLWLHVRKKNLNKNKNKFQFSLKLDEATSST